MRQQHDGGVRRRVSQVRDRLAHHAVLRGAERVWHDLRFKDLYQDGKEFELMGRALGFAALAMLTVSRCSSSSRRPVPPRIAAWPYGSSTAWA
jgi:hypothetical protein